jgi:3-hydroxybutyryl-CoA dehydrogenase
VAAGASVPAVAASAPPGLLAPLVERLRGAGVSIATEASLPADTVRVGGVIVALTDGRTLAERTAASPEPMLLLDLARDFSTTTVMGATGSAESLEALAALLRVAQIELIALADVAGLVLMRTVACLANEAADVMTWTGTTAVDIDIAMRLGTAYPVGPLAWADAIGVSRVVELLANLQSHYGEARYRRSPLLAAKHFAKAHFHG